MATEIGNLPEIKGWTNCTSTRDDWNVPTAPQTRHSHSKYWQSFFITISCCKNYTKTACKSKRILASTWFPISIQNIQYIQHDSTPLHAVNDKACLISLDGDQRESRKATVVCEGQTSHDHMISRLSNDSIPRWLLLEKSRIGFHCLNQLSFGFSVFHGSHHHRIFF